MTSTRNHIYRNSRKQLQTRYEHCIRDLDRETDTCQWLLYLLGDEDPQVVVFGTQILARLLVVLGPAYVTKFTGKTGGFTIMQNRLARWWDIPTLWPICFSILFGVDPAIIDFERPFELYSLLETFGDRKVVYPALLPVIVAMLQQGLNSILRNQDDPDSPHRSNSEENAPALNVPDVPSRRRSMSLTKELESRSKLNSNFILLFLLIFLRIAATK